ncbi:MAG: FecR domain-containing protein [Elusimicrobia bacterium]|nr:FecR domain-containing protein [Elusimicrobiota bacterium]
MKNLLLILALIVAPALAEAQGAAQRIGAAGAVSGPVKATAPGEAARELKSGSPVFLNDRVVTDSKSRLQVMLLDETVFTVGPNSDMTLDEFVYDPASSAGKVSAKVTKGVFRFVTGKVARKEPENMKVKMPVGTIGIRGTYVLVSVGGEGSSSYSLNGGVNVGGNPVAPGNSGSPVVGSGSARPAPLSETVILLGPGAGNNANEVPGAILVSNGSSHVFIDQPGFGVNITPGQGQLQASDMSAQISQLGAELETQSGQGAGQPGGQQPEQGSGGQPAPLSDAGSASEAAGQTTAAAINTLSDAAGLADVTQTLQDTSNNAATDIVRAEPSGPVVSTWDEVRGRTTGIATYAGTGLAVLAGTANGTYDVDFKLEVDFAGRTYGGSSSSISLSKGSLFDSANISGKSFSALSGNAAVTLLQTAGDIDNQNFDNSVITFLNADGGTANKVSLDLKYDDRFGTTGTGNAMALAPTTSIATWDEVRNSGYVGYMSYTGSGLAQLYGSAAGLYDTEFELLVDFTNRRYGDSASISHISILPTGSITPFDSTLILDTDFSSLTGAGVIQLSTLAQTANIDNSKFNGSAITLLNKDAGTANRAMVNINYNNPGMNTTGSGGILTNSDPVIRPM